MGEWKRKIFIVTVEYTIMNITYLTIRFMFKNEK